MANPDLSHSPLQAEERLSMVQEKRKLIEDKMGLEREIRKQERAAQEVILNKTKSARPKLSFGLKMKPNI